MRDFDSTNRLLPESGVAGLLSSLWPPCRKSQTLASFHTACLGIAAASAMLLGNAEFLIYSGVVGTISLLLASLHRHMSFPLLLLWGLSLWGISHLAGGLVPVPEHWVVQGESAVLYNCMVIPDVVRFDNLVHFCGSALVSLVFWDVLRRAISREFNRPLEAVRPTILLMILCGLCTQGFGALNELLEFGATLLLPNTEVGGYVNTGWDLVANLAGSGLALTALRCYEWSLQASTTRLDPVGAGASVCDGVC